MLKLYYFLVGVVDDRFPGVFNFLLIKLLDMVTTSEKNLTGKSLREGKQKVKQNQITFSLKPYILCLGELSFELIMKKGKNIENKHPLIIKESQNCVGSANTKPNPMK